MVVVIVQLLSQVQLFVTPWTAAYQASLSFTVSWSLLKLMSIELAMPSNPLILCHPLLLPSVFPSIRVFSNESRKRESFYMKINIITVILCLYLPSVFPSIGVFTNESPLRIRWLKYRNFSFSISPSNECSGLISLRIDWFDLLAVEGNLEYSPAPQFKSISSSALSFLYGPTLTSIHEWMMGKTIALTIWTFVGKVI